MIEYRFSSHDLLRTRFAISPLCEVCWSTNALLHPEKHALHAPWARRAQDRLRGLDGLELLQELNVSRGGYVPDFGAPPPTTPVADLREELERVRSTPHDRVAQEVAWRYAGLGSEIPAVVRTFLADLDRGLAGLVETVAHYFDRAIAPWWPEMRRVLEDDISHRAERLTTGGTGDVFADLHPDIVWRDGSLRVRRRHEATVDLGGRGLLLVPAVFAWPEAFTLIDEPWQPTVVYTPRGVGDLWAPRAPRDGRALAALLGSRRAQILTALDRPATTSALAAAQRLPPSSVSEHVAVLRAAGLVRSRRSGRLVQHARTTAGDVVVEGAAPSGTT
ncbi:hypothetical protein DSM112329_03168 [Paraconexibacter sp. AEG42_29]|uniref:HTH arsR-type domain-containing protein n=1 Tax=Paraconexibacter sp. AEG42_29 TaxID=2997339 RepID=A0AAU7AXU5_9ACTN